MSTSETDCSCGRKEREKKVKVCSKELPFEGFLLFEVLSRVTKVGFLPRYCAVAYWKSENVIGSEGE